MKSLIKRLKPDIIYRWILVWGCLLASLCTSMGQESQAGFAFIDHPSSTQQAALGGLNLTSSHDPLMFLANPSGMDSTIVGAASFHYLNFPGGVDIFQMGYHWSSWGNGIMGAGLQYFNYGAFEGYDETGSYTGKFYAREFAITLGHAFSQGVFQYGGSLKLLGSILESYNAYALAFDFGVGYQHPKKDLKMGMVVKNLGFPISSYLEGQKKLSLPTDIKIGLSIKPEHMPVRFHLTARNIKKEERDYFYSFRDSSNDQSGWGESVFRRLIWGAEILAHDNFRMQIGYNHLIRKELSVASGNGLGGFSGGFTLGIKKFELSYTRMFYQVASAANLIGITTNINDLRSF
ncbi:type IX secretion system protein PorQ [Echinicola jeungdonensis]|uniref:Type IX secretion system protein PorQ n=1 Tax=Echinicola jeungdonensis TaxID=709343 RepID=A0ABV5JAJ4_9BACT|nr:type IX secretion system protein PorQ [Echinicola jeungdonensis]MDN3670001.1 type IX secretion system protein PorQ [Echinicola jeungdonensis]